MPELNVDIKVTSVNQPQSSCPFKSARQKIFGLGYSLLIFVYGKTDDAVNRTANLNILHTIFVEKERTADYQMMSGLKQILQNHGNADDLVSFMQNRNLPIDEIEAYQVAEELLNGKSLIEGYLTISNALQWRVAVWASNCGSRENKRNLACQMISLIKDEKTKEFGDFQTPRELAFEICALLSRLKIQPQTVVEPNCGLGGFVAASRTVFHSAKIFGFDISSNYVEQTRAKFGGEENISVAQADFFKTDWREMFGNLQKPILVLGNPPWVTNSQLGVLASSNLPNKENFQKLKGLDAITGKSNFDISEWMLIRLFESLDKQNACLAMLVKTSVARKVLKYAWTNKIHLGRAKIYRVETERYFNASVDSCLLFCEFSETEQAASAKIFDNLSAANPSQEIGFRNGELIASMDLYEKWKYLNGGSKTKWRSGVKHDCSKIMELTKHADKFKNGFGELVEMESEFVYPLLKSSDIANGNLEPRRWVLVTQKDVKDDTEKIAELAPKTWNYLLSKAEYLDNRKSSIYKNRPRFSVFGIGNYSFAPWKVAISGFYKKLNFNVVGSLENKPIVLDDTCYFLPFETEREAGEVCDLLNSEIGREFFESFVFWDAKRPITVDILQKLCIQKLKNFNRTKLCDGLEKAISEMKHNYENQPFNSKVQNSFGFAEFK